MKPMLRSTFHFQTYSSSSSPDDADTSASEELAQIFSVNAEQTDAALRAFVSHACQLRNHKQLLKLLRILETAVLDGGFPGGREVVMFEGAMFYENNGNPPIEA